MCDKSLLSFRILDTKLCELAKKTIAFMMPTTSTNNMTGNAMIAAISFSWSSSYLKCWCERMSNHSKQVKSPVWVYYGCTGPELGQPTRHALKPNWFLLLLLPQRGGQELPDCIKPSEEKPESPAVPPGDVWKHLGCSEDSFIYDGPARTLPGCKYWWPGSSHAGLQPRHLRNGR